MMYHAEFILFGRDWFEGGFFGVDIFFVISGYLISRIILSELTETGSFSFPNFYERRARRILPMLFAVIFVSFPFAWRWLMPIDFEEFCNSIIASVFFGSNFFFYFATTEYGADSSLLKPFLHTWSLGVEEQFYIVFPVLLLTCYTYCRNYILHFCVAAVLLSFTFAIHMGLRNSDLNFFLPMSRVWELLIGTLLAYREVKHGRRQESSPSQLLPIIGLALIVISVCVHSADLPHPGFKTLMPVIGVALIIWFSRQDDAVGKLLGSRLCVGIGLISYSAYLWHYPIFAFSRINNSAPDNYDKVGWVVLTIVMSIASYYWIEQPFRRRSFLRKRLLTIGLATTLITVGGLQVASSYDLRADSRLPAILTHEDLTQRPWTNLRHNGRLCYGARCVFRNESSSLWIQLLGDSHIASLQSDLVSRLNDRANVVSWAIGGCWPTLNINRHNENDSMNGGCDADHQERRYDDISGVEKSIIVMSGRLPLYISRYGFDNQEGGVETFGRNSTRFHADFKTTEEREEFKGAVTQTLMNLLNQGQKIVLVYPIPEVGWNVPKKLLADMPMSIKNISEWLTNNPITTSYDLYIERSKESIELLDSIEHENLYRVYPYELFCDNQIKGRCVTHDDTHLFYADEGHPSYKGAEMINDLIIDKINYILTSADSIEL